MGADPGSCRIEIQKIQPRGNPEFASGIEGGISVIKFYKTQENRMTELQKYSEGCWGIGRVPHSGRDPLSDRESWVWMPSTSVRHWIRRRASYRKRRWPDPW